ncbi:TatD family hydrolase [Plectosphaerella cucumerina]|uniref:TatD family hydrolase n=1 Tax=Plectosphaerella cucumerina TaxID=40658 RepID=A0A8K0TGB1_9PEZI|nr:TatD family hydrolase [Plectosphaerella cucumerina]
MATYLLKGLPTEAPAKPSKPLRYADVAVTATAKEFAGCYRGDKQYHPPDFDAVLDRAQAAGVEKIMLTGMSLADVPVNLAIAASRPSQCFVTIGIHPYHAAEPDSAEGGEDAYFSQLEESVKSALALSPSPLAAFGELGLDWDRTAVASKEAQLRTFKRQLDLYVSIGLDLPLFLHCRAAYDDFVSVITPYLDRLPRRGLVHSFVGSAAQMRGLVNMGLDVSVNGFAFSDRESLEMVREVPLDKLQIETDAPWGEIAASSEVAKRYLAKAGPLPPSKKRDKFEMGVMVKTRNESCLLERVAFVVAGLKGVTVEEVAEAAWRNSVDMFGLGER